MIKEFFLFGCFMNNIIRKWLPVFSELCLQTESTILCCFNDGPFLFSRDECSLNNVWGLKATVNIGKVKQNIIFRLLAPMGNNYLVKCVRAEVFEQIIDFFNFQQIILLCSLASGKRLPQKLYCLWDILPKSDDIEEWLRNSSKFAFHLCRTVIWWMYFFLACNKHMNLH